MSQTDAILRHLRSGRPLTALEALRRFDVLRLGARVLELRQRGHDIITRMRTVRSGKRVAEYRLA
ncbi:helix-turn-helix domain-containing protein [Sphingomonas sp.]|jgi:hypothetical protein|uniref:helix-turn-helix domain-containing protein n=1 Tax=Sphingomonas sp. TaxID=28214 RepID=UPI003566E46D